MLVEVGAYIGYFASEMITENIRKLARRLGGRERRTFLTGTKPITDTEKSFAGGAVGCLSTEKSGLGSMDSGGKKAFCSSVYLFVNS